MNAILPTIVTDPSTLAQWALIGYFLGSVPYGMIVSRLLGLGDLRSIGSGNIGATNVLRTGNKGAAALTLILDAAKGAIAVTLAHKFAGPDAAQLAALAAFLGHCFPVWLRFRGGKGVATFLGLWIALALPVALAACATWLVAATLSRISSVGALAAAALTPLWAWMMGFPDLVILALVLAVLIAWRHSENIARLRAGIEPKMGRK